MDDKTKSIVAHLWFLGWIISLVMNQSDKGANTSFYLRQTLGLYLISLAGLVVGSLTISTIYYVIALAVFVLWVLSLVGALSGEQKASPVVGDMFQQWFKAIS